MTLTEKVAQNIIKKLLSGDDYRIEVITLINAQFLQFAIDFFKKIINAKLNQQNITTDWYKDTFLNEHLAKKEIAINSGLNMKTISNMYNTATKQIVINAANEHYEILYNSIQSLVETEQELELNLTIKLHGVAVDLNVSETLIVINTLAVKRAELRGGLWSTAGKRVEKPLMQTLCKLYNLPEQNYKIKLAKTDNNIKEEFQREVDFYLCNNSIDYKCEVKLMGKGNPESADAVIARDSKIFIADKLSDTNKAQLNSLDILWVELRNKEQGFKAFKNVLTKLNIPHSECILDIEKELDNIFTTIFS